jgi:hypothetical protein
MNPSPSGFRCFQSASHAVAAARADDTANPRPPPPPAGAAAPPGRRPRRRHSRRRAQAHAPGFVLEELTAEAQPHADQQKTVGAIIAGASQA